MNIIAKSFINFTNTISTLTAAVPFKKHLQTRRSLGAIVNANRLCVTSLNGSSQAKRLIVKQHEIELNSTNADERVANTKANLASLPDELLSGEIAIAVADTELFSTVSALPAGTYHIHDLLQVAQQQLPMQLEALYLDFFIVGPNDGAPQLNQKGKITVTSNHHMFCQALPSETFQHNVQPSVPDSYTITTCCSRLHALIVLCDGMIRGSIQTEQAWCLAYPQTPNGDVIVLLKISKGSGWPSAEIELGPDWQRDTATGEQLTHLIDQQVSNLIIIPFSPNHLDVPIENLWLSNIPDGYIAASPLQPLNTRWLWYSQSNGAGLLSLSELRHSLLTSSESMDLVFMRLLSLAAALVQHHRHRAERVRWWN